MENYILEMDGIVKQFSHNTVLHSVHFDLKPGEVHALMGENGAGKSTLMRILMGIIPRDEGKIVLNGEEVTFHSPKEALEHGIAMIHQELNPILDMSISENIFVGKELVTSSGKLLRVVDKGQMLKQTEALLEEVGIDIDPRVKMRSLSVAQCQAIEIAKAISWNSKIIIMDEPTSAISEKETENLFREIKKLCSKGVAIIYISHKLDEIFKIANRVTVFRDGQYIGTNDISEIDTNALITMMVGREIKDVYPKKAVPIGDVVMEVNGLSYAGKVHDVSFQVKKGEILGIAGLVGAGRSELVETIFGMRRKSAGEIKIDGRILRNNHPWNAIRNKIALITEDRKITGLNLKASIKDNITLVSIKKLTVRHLLNKKNECKVSNQYMQELKIKAPSIQTRVGSLSGGNQQKVVVAKWLLSDPDIVIMDEPTRGIDVGAKRDIYLLMNELVSQGKSVVMISSEIQELLGMCDRIIVLCDGKLTGEFDRDSFDQENIMKSAFNTEGIAS